MSHHHQASRGRRCTIVAALLAISTFAHLARAQQSGMPTPLDSVNTGARVRAISNAGRDTLEAFLRDVRGETLFVVRCLKCDTPATPIALGPMLELQTQRRRIAPYFIAQDAIVGLLAGAVVGAGVGAVVAYHDARKPRCGDLCGLDWLLVPALGAIGGSAGLVTGGILGATAHRESYWVQVTLPMSIR